MFDRLPIGRPIVICCVFSSFSVWEHVFIQYKFGVICIVTFITSATGSAHFNFAMFFLFKNEIHKENVYDQIATTFVEINIQMFV